MVMPALLSFVLVEISAKVAKGASPTNFWEALVQTPQVFKGKAAFGDLFGSDYLIHGFDCGAIYDPVTGVKVNPCASIPDHVGQYSLLALLYAVIISFCFIQPAQSGSTIEYVVTNTLIGYSDPTNIYPQNLKPAHAASVACNQHLRFLDQNRGYNNQAILQHLMKTFIKALENPPPIHCRNFHDAERYHSAFAATVARANDVNEAVASINKEVANQEWEKNVLAIQRLPLVDSPLEEVSHEASKKGKGVLVEYEKALAVTQTAPRIARAYTALNEAAAKLSVKEDKEPFAIKFARMFEVSGGLKAKDSNAYIVKDGVDAFNELLTLNGGKIAVECGREEIQAIKDDTPIYAFVTRKAEDFKNATPTELEGLFMHALLSISQQVPSSDSLSDKMALCKECIGRILLLGKKDFVSQSATLWSMYNKSSGASATMRNAANKVLEVLCEEASTIHITSHVQAAIANFFILPTMQIQIEKDAFFAPFCFPREEIDPAANKKRIQQLEAEARELTTTILKEEYFKNQTWPFPDGVEVFKGHLNDKLRISEKLRIDFLSNTNAMLAKITSDLKAEQSSKLLAQENLQDNVRNVVQECCPFVPPSEHRFGFAKKEGILTVAHLPMLIDRLLVSSDAYLDNAKAGLGAAYCESLPPGVDHLFERKMTAKDGPLADMDLDDKKDLLTAFKDYIPQSLVDQKPSDSIYEYFAKSMPEPEMIALLETKPPLPPICFRHAAHLMALIDKVLSGKFQDEHEEQLPEGELYELDLPNEKRKKPTEFSFGAVPPAETEEHEDRSAQYATNSSSPGNNANRSNSPPPPVPPAAPTTATGGTATRNVSTTVQGQNSVSTSQETINIVVDPNDSWEDMYKEDLKLLAAHTSSLGKHVGRFCTYDTSLPTPFINRILKDHSTFNNIIPTKGLVTLITLSPVEESLEMYCIKKTSKVLASEVTIPEGAVAFQRYGRILTLEAVKKAAGLVFVSEHHQSATLTFRMCDAKDTDKPSKVSMCSTATIGDVTMAISEKLQGVQLVPACTTPIDSRTTLHQLLETKKSSCIFYKAPSANPIVQLRGHGKSRSLELFAPNATIRDTALAFDAVSKGELSSLQSHDGTTKVSLAGNLPSLFTWRARAQLPKEGTQPPPIAFTFRANIVDPSEDTSRLATITAPTPSLTCRELLARLVEAGQVDGGLTCTVVRVASGVAVGEEEEVAHTSQLAVYPQGEGAQALTTQVVVGESQFTFFVDATVGKMSSYLVSKLPEMEGKPLWMQGVDVSDAAFEDVRLAQLLCSQSNYSSWIDTLVTQLIGTRDETDDLFASNTEEEAIDFFGDEIAGEAVEENREEPNIPKILTLSTDGPNKTEKDNKTVVVRLHSSSLIDYTVNLQCSAITEAAVATPLLTLLSIVFSLPPSFIAPSIRMGTEKMPASITIVRSTDESVQFEVYIEPVKEFEIALIDRYELGDDGTMAPIKNLSVLFFAPVTDPLSMVTRAENLQALTSITQILTSSTAKSNFNTKDEEEEADAYEATEDHCLDEFTQQRLLHLVVAVAGSILGGQGLVAPPPHAKGVTVR